MAIYYYDRKIASRTNAAGGSQNVVAAAAYYRRETRLDKQTGETYGFEGRGKAAYCDCILPPDAPEWAMKLKAADKSKDGRERSEILWDMINVKERRKDSQVYVRDIVAIPKELNKAAGIELAYDYVKDVLAQSGIFCDLAVHWDKGNPHFHVMMPAFRKLTEDGFSKKERPTREQLVGKLNIDRKTWAQYCNARLAIDGFDVKVDHRSYKEQGVDLIPTQKEGRSQLGKLRAIENIQIQKENLSRIQSNPEVLATKVVSSHVNFTSEDVEGELKRYLVDNTVKMVKLSKQVFAQMQFRKSVFSGKDIRNEIRKKGVGLTVEQQKKIVTHVLSSGEILTLGVGEDGREHYTTRNAYKTETEMIEETKKLSCRMTHSISPDIVEKTCMLYTLNPDQRRAVKHITQGVDIVMVRGMAGTGKTYLLKPAKEIWQASGHKVYGIAVAGKAARGIEEGSGIKSFTMDSFLYLVGNGKLKMNQGDVVVVDEAGMMTLDRMHTLVNMASVGSLKLVVIGDPEQTQPIGRGAPAKALMETIGAVTLSEIVRQKMDWQKEATFNMETGAAGEGLDIYKAQGHLKYEETKEAAIKAIMGQWTGWLMNHGWDCKRAIMAAYRNETVDTLNLQARNFLVEIEKLQQGNNYKTAYGEIAISEGERILFRKNQRRAGMMNGDMGTVKTIKGSMFEVVLDNGKTVNFNISSYNAISYGYASTVHKLQGHTTEQCLFYVDSRGIDRHVFLVGASRHKDGLTIFADKKTFPSYGELKYAVSRKGVNDNIVDYPVSFSVRNGADREFAGGMGIKVGSGIKHYITDKFRWLFNLQEAIEINRTLPAHGARELAKVAADFCDRKWDSYDETKQLRETKRWLGKYVLSDKDLMNIMREGTITDDKIDDLIARNKKIKQELDKQRAAYSVIYRGKLDNAWRAKVLKEQYQNIEEILNRNNVSMRDIDGVLDFKARHDEVAQVVTAYRKHGAISIEVATRIIGSPDKIKRYWGAISENTRSSFESAAFVSELKKIVLVSKLPELKLDDQVKAQIKKYMEADTKLKRARAQLYLGEQGFIEQRKSMIEELEQARDNIVWSLRGYRSVLERCQLVMELAGQNTFRVVLNKNEHNGIDRHDQSDMLSLKERQRSVQEEKRKGKHY